MSQAASREWMENMCTAELPQFECDEIEFSDEFTSRKELQHQVLADNKNWAVGWMMCHIIFLSGIARPSIFIYFFFFIIFFSSPHYNLKTHRLFVSNTQLTVFFFRYSFDTHFTKSTKTPPTKTISPKNGTSDDIDDADSITELITFISLYLFFSLFFSFSQLRLALFPTHEFSNTRKFSTFIFLLRFTRTRLAARIREIFISFCYSANSYAHSNVR